MPIYRYRVQSADPAERVVFDVVQRMGDPPLTTHPETGQPVTRVLTAPSKVAMGRGDVMSSANLAKNGFAKYEKTGDGTYTRTAGTGPQTIQR